MHLKRLELQGFKSFPDRIVIRFESGITAIVGPNGSGKERRRRRKDPLGCSANRAQNSFAASKWRTSSSTETQRRKPQPHCEVSLVFDNEDHALGIDYTEVAVTRRMYRDGKSEYYINKNGCRLRDADRFCSAIPALAKRAIPLSDRAASTRSCPIRRKTDAPCLKRQAASQNTRRIAPKRFAALRAHRTISSASIDILAATARAGGTAQRTK